MVELVLLSYLHRISVDRLPLESIAHHGVDVQLTISSHEKNLKHHSNKIKNIALPDN